MLFTEANASIGTGHLTETLHLAEAAQAVGIRPVLVAPSEAPEWILRAAPCPVERIEGVSADRLSVSARQMRSAGAYAALTDFRLVTDAQLLALSDAGLATYCVDELGARELTCAAVFNPTVLDHRHHYGAHDSQRVFAGPAYFPLAPAYADGHARTRTFSGGIRSVIVTMGGVDRSGATLRIFDVLDAWPGNAERHVVIGGAFASRPAFDARLVSARRRWHVHQNVLGLADLLVDADVAITAGGNTLYELACVGTPAIVLHEDQHEAEQGQAFEGRGFGVWIGRGADFDGKVLLAALERFEDADVRRTQSAAGRSIVDGRGPARICAIVQQDVGRYSAAQT